MISNIVFATNNPNKLFEVQNLLGNSFKLLSPAKIGCHDDLPENQPTLEGNALEKARYIFQKYKINCFADDTGLEIEALNGKPGVLSARYAGHSKDPIKNMEKVLNKLQGISNRNGRFRTIIALILEGKEYCFEGIINGSILESAHGDMGFGYDPIFKPIGFDFTFAEMNIEDKNKISHRAIAINKLVSFLKTDINLSL
jgi:XTP/dITP diphosphohydrolase